MREVLISIQPKWCELIANGSKTIEVRKTKPKLETPFKVYIYCTKARNYFSCHGGIIEASDTLYKLPTGVIKCDSPFELQVDYEGQYDKNNFLNGKVIGEFVCDEIECFTTDYRANKEQTERISKQSCVSWLGMEEYEINSHCLYGWHISNLVIYDKPKELSEFITPTTCKSGIAKEMLCNTCCLSANFCSKKPKRITRPPQSWCYVESLGDT